jgi:hypothetical protein
MSDKQEGKGTMYAFATIGARPERAGAACPGSYERVGEAQMKREGEAA